MQSQINELLALYPGERHEQVAAAVKNGLLRWESYATYPTGSYSVLRVTDRGRDKLREAG